MTGGSPLSRSQRPPLTLAAGRLLARFSLRGRGRLARYLWQRYRGPARRLVTVTTRAGHVVQLPAGSSQTWIVAYTGCYDDEEITLLASLIEPGSVVLDIGACFGLYTLPLAEAARGRDAAVIAVEPVPRNIELLRANLERNGLAGPTSIVPYALGEQSGQVEMQVERGAAGNAAICASGPLAVPGPDAVSTGVQRLDDAAIPELDDRRCSLVKMDVEGYELSVLRGAERLIMHDRPVVFGEFSPDWFHARGVALNAPRRWAVEHGYRVLAVRSVRQVFWSDRRRIVPDPNPPEGWRGHLLMVPREHSTCE